MNNPPTAVGGIPRVGGLSCRLPSNNPPTAVGGILTFEAKRLTEEIFLDLMLVSRLNEHYSRRILGYLITIGNKFSPVSPNGW